MSNLSFHTSTIPPGGLVPVAAFGRMFYCHVASLPFDIQLEDGERLEGILPGFSVKREIEKPFRFIRLYNPNTVPITVTYYYGDVDIGMLTREMRSASTTAIAAGPDVSNDYLLNAAAQIALTGINNGRTRRTLTITNASTNGFLRIIDTQTATPLALVFPMSQFTMQTSSAVVLKNDNIYAMEVYVWEEYYA